MKQSRTVTSVAEHAERWAALVARRDPADLRADGLPVSVRPRGPRPVGRIPGTGQPVMVTPGDTGTPLAGPGVLELDLNAREIAYLGAAGQSGLLDLADADVAFLGVSRAMYLRVVMNITEYEFTDLVVGMAEAEDVLTHHCGKASYCRGGPGFPDLTLAGRARVMFAELKRLYQEDLAPIGWGVRTDEQVMWGERLTAITGYVCWTPADLLHIRADLQALHAA